MRLFANFKTQIASVSQVVQYTLGNEERLTLGDKLLITNRVLARKSNTSEIPLVKV